MDFREDTTVYSNNVLTDKWEGKVSEPVYVLNDDIEYFNVNYYDTGDPSKRSELESGWQAYKRIDPSTKRTFDLKIRPSNYKSEVSVDYFLPPGNKPGRFRIETFIPGQHATTRKAIFSILHNEEDERGISILKEAIHIVDMMDLKDVWKPLGTFHLDPRTHPDVGRVRQYDITQEDPPTEISFGPVRWIPLFYPEPGHMLYNSPVGTEEERRNLFPIGGFTFGKYPIWVGEWYDINPFLTWYMYGYHTGADLNLPGGSAADKGKPIHVISDGLVTYAGKAGNWGNIIVVEHPEAYVTHPDGHIERQKVYSRYGHVDDEVLVDAGDVVSLGQQVGYVGLPAGSVSGWHLHFDVSYTDILKDRPSHWPDIQAVRRIRSAEWADERRNRARSLESVKSAIKRDVINNYVDPLQFIEDNHGFFV